MDTSKLSAFIAAAEAGTLSLAARRLGVQLSTMSRQIADLERTLGAPLLVRTGRGVRVTAEGGRFLVRARNILYEFEAGAVEVRGSAAPTLTQLRISSPPDLSLRLLPAPLVDLARRYPDLAIEARTDSRRVSLAEEEYDAAIRLGPLRDSELVARRLGAVSRWVCAAPEVAKSIRALHDLARRPCVLVSNVPGDLRATFRGRQVTVHHTGRLRVASFLEAAEVAARSDRIVVLPSFTAAAHLENGTLARVLPALKLPTLDAQLVHPQRHRGSLVLRDLGDLVAAALEVAERAGNAKRAVP